MWNITNTGNCFWDWGGERSRRGPALNPPEPLWPAVSSQSQDWNWIHKTEPDTISARPASLPPEVWHEGQEEEKKRGGRRTERRGQGSRGKGAVGSYLSKTVTEPKVKEQRHEVQRWDVGSVRLLLRTLHLITNLYIRTRRGESLHCWAFPIH